MGFQVRKVADIGSSTPWVARLWIGVINVRDSVFNEATRGNFDNKYAPILDNLLECYNAMRLLHRTLSEHETKAHSQQIFTFQNRNLTVTESIDVTMNQAFKDFFIKGNIAINHVFSFSKFMGHNISFLRKNKDNDFEESASKLVSNCPETKALVEMLRGDRTTWYKYFVDVRDRIEHESLPRLVVQYSGESPNVRAHFPLIDHVGLVDLTTKVWDNLFEFVEDTAIFLLSLKLRPPLKIAIVPEGQRDPAMPIKYVITADIRLPIAGDEKNHV